MRNIPGPRSPAQALDDDACALYEAMSDLIKVYQFRDRDRTHCHGISVTECYALETVDRHAPLRLGDLARRLHVEKSTASRVVEALKQKGRPRRGGGSTSASPGRPGSATGDCWRRCRRLPVRW